MRKHHYKITGEDIATNIAIGAMIGLALAPIALLIFNTILEVIL